MINSRNNDDSGFTLVELLVVLVIIGILTAIAIPTLNSQRSKASGATAISDLRNMATFEEAQMADSGSYAADVDTLAADGLHRSPGLKLGLAVSLDGYCGVAQEHSTFWWFDSGAGGVQHASTTDLTPPSSANGVCSTSVPTVVS